MTQPIELHYWPTPNGHKITIALEEMGRLWLPVEKDWRLNERHYGGLTGLDKAETTAKHGEAQVKVWRRSYDVPPPPLAPRSPPLPSCARRPLGRATGRWR